MRRLSRLANIVLPSKMRSNAAGSEAITATSDTYGDADDIEEIVSRGGHREIIGGLWDEVGKLQFDFLRSQGLSPESVLLDIGCGSLRGGVHFIRYLDPGNYFGLDRHRSLLDAGFHVELARENLQHKISPHQLICNSEFDFSAVRVPVQFALAQSLFTHLPLNAIRQCLHRLAPVMAPSGSFFATYFACPEDWPLDKPRIHEPGGVVTTAVSDPYHYRDNDFVWAAHGVPWRLDVIGDWQHPRAQRMLRFTRI